MTGMEYHPPVPMMLITGFLGAGKTTLVNHLLAEGIEQGQVAVIVNDFGRVSVDTSLIMQSEENMLTLANGCVCCSLAGDLAAGLVRLLEKGAFKYIIMESSGVTRVTPLRMILNQSELRQMVELESVVVMVDPARYPMLSSVIMTLDEQVRHADVLVINRSDVTTAEQLKETFKLLKISNPDAHIIRTEFGKVDWAILRAGAAEGRTMPLITDLPADQWSMFQLNMDQPCKEDELKDLLDSLPGRVRRAKGWVHDLSGGILHVEQVNDEITMSPWSEPLDEGVVNCLAVIIPSDDADALKKWIGRQPGITLEPESSMTHHVHKYNSEEPHTG
jgi:G3E family GTPase